MLDGGVSASSGKFRPLGEAVEGWIGGDGELELDGCSSSLVDHSRFSLELSVKLSHESEDGDEEPRVARTVEEVEERSSDGV